MELPGLIFGAMAIVAGSLLIAFRGKLAQRDSAGRDKFFERKRNDVAKADPSTMWITLGGVVAIAIGVAAAIQAFV